MFRTDLSQTVQNVHNLSLTEYCEQDRLSLYPWGNLGGDTHKSQFNLRSACVLERAQPFVTKGDEPVTVTPE